MTVERVKTDDDLCLVVSGGNSRFLHEIQHN